MPWCRCVSYIGSAVQTFCTKVTSPRLIFSACIRISEYLSSGISMQRGEDIEAMIETISVSRRKEIDPCCEDPFVYITYYLVIWRYYQTTKHKNVLNMIQGTPNSFCSSTSGHQGQSTNLKSLWDQLQIDQNSGSRSSSCSTTSSLQCWSTSSLSLSSSFLLSPVREE